LDVQYNATPSLVQAGHAAGWRDRLLRLQFYQAHVLKAGGFDEAFYRQEAAAAQQFAASPVNHYLEVGWRLGLDPAPWFSTSGYLADNPDVALRGLNPFFHYLRYGRKEGRPPGKAVMAPSPSAAAEPPKVNGVDHGDETLTKVAAHMDIAFYEEQLGRSVTATEAAAHFIAEGIAQGLDPRRDFSASSYLEDHEDIARAGINPFVHYVMAGQDEGRQTRLSLVTKSADGADGRSEWQGYGAVIRKGDAAVVIGPQRFSALDFTVTLAGSDLVRELMQRRLKRPETADRAEASSTPTLSVVIPCWEQATITAECLASLLACSAEVSLEIIVVNNASKDDFYQRLRAHPEITVLDMPRNVGFGPGVNAGVKRAQGQYVMVLNNDVQVAPGALSAMVEALETMPKVGVVGPKVISFDGRLQEAGALLRSDGSGQFIGFSGDIDDPRFNYPRAVEHLSATGIIVRRALFEELGGFDDIYAPAYCEDADFSLKVRQAGALLWYQPKAVIAHHLSKSTDSKEAQEALGGKLQLVKRNQVKLIDRWVDKLLETDMRTIAFYLPQYHPIPENDLWWGKGFTEWTNLSKAKPNFAGHRQPRRPADLGYYDLRAVETMEHQAALARRYGVSAFCYYYYRFGDKRLLEMPLERMLETGRPDFPFCLCWANENWSRRWDGESNDILMQQKYAEADAIGFAEDTARYFASANYVTVNGAPLILFYRLQEIPNPKRYLGVCRNVWRSMGFDQVVVAMVESFELSAAPRDPAAFGADITVEFPAHGMVHDPPQRVRRLNKVWKGNAHDYRELAGAFMSRPDPGFKRLRSVLVGWDTTPRHPDKSLVLQSATPGALQAWLEWTYQRTREQNWGDERIVFINAWNEWCEGSYLEPDTDYGHAHLQAVRNALDTVTLGRRSFVEVE
jgi:GT2 family glycosyltransferase